MTANTTAIVYTQHSYPAAFLFPGQGSQHVGMCQELASAYPAAQAVFAEADEVLGFALSELCFSGPEERLTETVNAQPALLAASIATLRALEQELGEVPRPCFMAGHSMGEYSALVAANAMTLADGLRLVRERGRLMAAAGNSTPGMMAAILGLDETAVAALCARAAAASGGVAQVANDNCPGQVVISGDHAGMAAAIAAAQEAGARKVVPLAVSIAAHSPLMAPAERALQTAIAATPITSPLVPILANTSASAETSVAALRTELRAQLTGSVRWATSIQAMIQQGVSTFVEIGPGEVLTGLVKRIDRSVARRTVNSPADVAQFQL